METILNHKTSCRKLSGFCRYFIITVFFILSFNGEKCYAYEKDTHYYLTYCLARLVGYTAKQAHEIANEAWSVDVNTATEPVQSVFNPTDSVRMIRARFHAMPFYKDEVVLPRFIPKIGGMAIPLTGVLYDSALYVAKVKQGEDALWNSALKNGNLGVFIHYLQDEYAHQGFYASWGHPPTNGATADYVSHNVDMANSMAIRVVGKMGAFMLQYLHKPPCQVDPVLIGQLVTALKNANPNFGIDVPFVSLLAAGFGQFSALLTSLKDGITSIPGSVMGKRTSNPDKNAWEAGETPYVEIFGNTGPDVEKAKGPLEAILKETIPQFNCYHYERAGSVYSGQGVTINYVPVWDIEGYWKYAAKIRGNTCSKNDSELFIAPALPDSINSSGKFCWINGTFDSVKQVYNFSRFPSPQEMDDSIPQVSRQKINGKLQWHMVLKLECDPKGTKVLKEYLYKGIVKIPEDRDASGNLLRKKVEEAYVDEKKFGWGEAKESTLHWSRVLLGD
jgi:hypothetical protein